MNLREKELELAHSVIRDVVVKGKTPAQVAFARGPEVTVGDVEQILQSYPGVVKSYRDAQKAVQRKRYERMAGKGLVALERILRTPPVDAEGKIDVQLAKLQKEIATDILEATGAKKARPKGGGIQVNTQVNGGGPRTRRRGPVKVVEADARLLLESAQLDANEIKEIEQ